MIRRTKVMSIVPYERDIQLKKLFPLWTNSKFWREVTSDEHRKKFRPKRNASQSESNKINSKQMKDRKKYLCSPRRFMKDEKIDSSQCPQLHHRSWTNRWKFSKLPPRSVRNLIYFKSKRKIAIKNCINIDLDEIFSAEKNYIESECHLSLCEKKFSTLWLIQKTKSLFVQLEKEGSLIRNSFSRDILFVTLCD